ncbi:MAG TPA: threonine aldolase family protein, partial [Chloroflexota bacterium]
MMDRVIDLRSDTVTLPTERMRLAMQLAEVGDSQKREDPSVNRLEAMAAEKLGKEAAIFLPSGTMSNLIAIMSHTHRGEKVIAGQLSHIINSEGDGVTSIAGLMPQIVPDQDGIPDPADVERAILLPSADSPHTTLVCLENTHNWASGAAATPAEVAAVAAVAHRHGLKVHVDGARLFNAAVALKVEAKELV